MKKDPLSYTFSHPVFSTNPFARSLVRVLWYSFFIIVLGLVVALMISDFPPLRWAGVLVILVVVDYFLHVRSAPYTLRELSAGRVPSDNLSYCMDRVSLLALLHAFERAQITGGHVALHVLEELSEKKGIVKTLERLDISAREFEGRIEDARAQAQTMLSTQEAHAQIYVLALRALEIAASHGYRSIDAEALWVGALYQESPQIARVRDYFSLNPSHAEAAVAFSRFLFSPRQLPTSTGGFAMKIEPSRLHRVNRSFTSRPTPVLNSVSIDVTDVVRTGRGGFLVGHKEEYERLEDVLSRPGLRNVVLVGESGVGKEALVYRLAFHIISDAVPGPLFDRRVVQFSVGDVVAGASPEVINQRMQKIIEEIQHAGNIALYIPDLHLLARSSQGGVGALDMLLPVLEHSDFPVIGAMHPRAYAQVLQERPDFERVFERVEVQEISVPEAIRLLSYDAMILEKRYRVAVLFSAVVQAVTLAKKYIHTSPLPSSAQDVLREAMADATQHRKKKLTGDDVVDIVERKVQVPIHRSDAQESETLLEMEKHIHESFIDQEHAVVAVSDALRAYRSGLAGGGGPIASFLFVGPTGVGKTQLSKVLTKIQFGSKKHMLRFDMSEYQNKEDVARFIGSADGKIAGALTEGVMHQPYSLILFDEFEKAHPDILNLFLQVFDEGRLTDSLGRVVDFSNTICIATSNAESVFIQEKVLQGVSMDDMKDELIKKLSAFFRPELLNRFSDVVIFTALSQDDITAIARLKLQELSELLSEGQGIVLKYDDAVVVRVGQLGYDPAFGARPIDRAIDDHLKAALSKELLANNVSRGGTIVVSVDAQGVFIFTPEG